MCLFLTIGDFKPLQYEIFGSDTNITIAEDTKGRSNMDTFTLLWAEVATKPISFNATESEVCCVKMLKPEVSQSEMQCGWDDICLIYKCKILVVK